MNCEEARKDFSALLDGELTPPERERVEAHLSQCANCLRELDSFKRVDLLYRALPQQSAPQWFEEKVRKALKPGVIHLATERLRRRPVWPLLLAAAMFAILLGGVLFKLGPARQRMEMASAPEQAPIVAPVNEASPQPAPSAGAAGGGLSEVQAEAAAPADKSLSRVTATEMPAAREFAAQDESAAGGLAVRPEGESKSWSVAAKTETAEFPKSKQAGSPPPMEQPLALEQKPALDASAATRASEPPPPAPVAPATPAPAAPVPPAPAPAAPAAAPESAAPKETLVFNAPISETEAVEAGRLQSAAQMADSLTKEAAAPLEKEGLAGVGKASTAETDTGLVRQDVVSMQERAAGADEEAIAPQSAPAEAPPSLPEEIGEEETSSVPTLSLGAKLSLRSEESGKADSSDQVDTPRLVDRRLESESTWSAGPEEAPSVTAGSSASPPPIAADTVQPETRDTKKAETTAGNRARVGSREFVLHYNGWFEEGYARETCRELALDSKEVSELVKKDPALTDVFKLGQPVTFRIEKTWYKVVAPTQDR